MPRKARTRTDNRMYHVMLRGINRQQVFLEPEDYVLFLEGSEDRQGTVL